MGKFSIENLSEFLGRSISKLKADIEKYKPINLSGKEEIYSNGCSHEGIKCLVKYGEKVAICFKNGEEFQKTRNASISGGKLKLKGNGRRKLDLNSIKIIDEIKNSLDLKNKICKLPEDKDLPDINIASLCEQLGLEGNLIDCTRKKVEGTSNQEIKSSGISQYEFYVNSEERDCDKKLRYFKKENKIVLAFLNSGSDFKLKQENEILKYKKVNLDTILKLEETGSNEDIFRQVHDLKLTESISKKLGIDFSYSEAIGRKLYKLISESKVELYVSEKKEVLIDTLKEKEIKNIEIEEIKGLERYSTFYEKVIKEGIIRSKDIKRVLVKLQTRLNVNKEEIEKCRICYEDGIKVDGSNKVYKSKDGKFFCIIKSGSEIETVKGNFQEADGDKNRFFDIINYVDKVEEFDPLVLVDDGKVIEYSNENEECKEFARKNIRFIVRPKSKLGFDGKGLLSFEDFDLEIPDFSIESFVNAFNTREKASSFLDLSDKESIKEKFKLYAKGKFKESRDLFTYNINLNGEQKEEIIYALSDTSTLVKNHIVFEEAGSNLSFGIRTDPKFYIGRRVIVSELDEFESYDLEDGKILVTKPYDQIDQIDEFLRFFDDNKVQEVRNKEAKTRFLKGRHKENISLIRNIVAILKEKIKDKKGLVEKFKSLKLDLDEKKFILDKLVSLEAIDEDVEKEILEEKEAEGNDDQYTEEGQNSEGEIGAEANVLPEDAGEQQQMVEADDPDGSNDGIGEGEKEILYPEQLKQEADQEIQVKLDRLNKMIEDIIGENENREEGEE